MTQPPNAPGPYGPPNNGWQQQPTYGPGQQQYGGPAQAPPQYGGPGQPQYGPAYGPGQPPYGPAYGPGGPGGRGPRRTPLYVAVGVVVALLLVGVGVLFATNSGDSDANGPTQPSTAPSAPASSSSEPSGRPSPPPASSAPPAAPRLAEARTLATSFVGYLNANDQTHATALGCEESRKLLAGQLIVTIDPPTKLAVTGPGVSVSSYYPRISVPFSGTTNGSVPLTGTVDIMDIPSRPLCVRLTSIQH